MPSGPDLAAVIEMPVAGAGDWGPMGDVSNICCLALLVSTRSWLRSAGVHGDEPTRGARRRQRRQARTPQMTGAIRSRRAPAALFRDGDGPEESSPRTPLRELLRYGRPVDRRRPNRRTLNRRRDAWSDQAGSPAGMVDFVSRLRKPPLAEPLVEPRGGPTAETKSR